MTRPRDFFAGLDLGQSTDFSALCIVHKRPILGELNCNLERPLLYHELRCLFAERIPLGTPYPAVVRYVIDRLESPALRGRTELALDYTGVGAPVADMFSASPLLSCPITHVSIHGGMHTTWEGRHAHVAKRTLIATTNIELQEHRLRIDATLPHAALLRDELRNFTVKIDPVTSHDSYSAWRENMHDDLLLALSLAVWSAAESQPVRFVRLTGVSRTTGGHR